MLCEILLQESSFVQLVKNFHIRRLSFKCKQERGNTPETQMELSSPAKISQALRKGKTNLFAKQLTGYTSLNSGTQGVLSQGVANRIHGDSWFWNGLILLPLGEVNGNAVLGGVVLKELSQPRAVSCRKVNKQGCSMNCYKHQKEKKELNFNSFIQNVYSLEVRNVQENTRNGENHGVQ